jgi:hypothetical protein
MSKVQPGWHRDLCVDLNCKVLLANADGFRKAVVEGRD